MKTKLMVILVLLLASLVIHISSEAAQSIDLFTDQNIDMSHNYQDGDHVLRSSMVQINPLLIEAMEGIDKKHTLSSLQLRMTFFFESPMFALFNRWERVSPTGLALIGTVKGIPGSEVIFVANGSALTGNITLPGRLFHIRPKESGVHELQDVDLKNYPEHLQPIPVSAEPGSFTLDPPITNDGTQLDVLVVYTADARTAAGGTPAIESQIDLAVAETNQGYINSGVTQRIRLVHKEEINYSESGFDWSSTLSLLQGTADGYMDNVHTLRNTYNADLVVMIVSASNYCGLGYLMQTVSPSFAAYAFCLVSRTCATGYYSFAHEMGHNMGAHHDRANASGTGAYPYSYGYQAPDQTFRTVMAYNCPGSCQRINYWSNPDVNYNGKPTGVLHTDPNSADNRRTLNNTVSTVANFRAGGLSLSVQKAGTGTGNVTSNPPGIDCGSTCSSTFSDGSIITLTATAIPGSVFEGWSGDGCSGTGVCVVMMNGDVSVTAIFSHHDVPPGLSQNEGTLGTKITITGSGFGEKKGKVLIGGIATKIAKDGWGDSAINCTVTKVLPPEDPYNMTIMVQPYKTTPPITLTDAFTVKNPELDPLTTDQDHGSPGTPITITGRFFGIKKGKVYLEDPVSGQKKACRVTEWSMDPTNGESRLTFVVPKLTSGDYTLKVANKVGQAQTTSTFSMD